ncbi:MAG TPA: hypothetical protein VGD37_12405 [Kofleriaceae bacterium]|jgi:hypothetical protein
MARTITTWLLIAFIVGCGSSGGTRTVVPPRGSVKIQTWPGATGAPLWPASARRVQAIVTSSPRDPYYLIWVVVEGSQLVAVYSVTAADRADMYRRVNEQRPRAISFVQVCTNGDADHAGLLPRRTGPQRSSRDNLNAMLLGQPSSGAAGATTTGDAGPICGAYTPPRVDVNPPGDPDPDDIRRVLELARFADDGFQKFIAGFAGKAGGATH